MTYTVSSGTLNSSIPYHTSVYHTPRRPQLQFYDVIFSLVIIRLLVHWHNDLQHCVKIAEREAQRRSNVLRVKKLFVLAALLIEQYHQHMRSSQQDKTKKRRPEVTLYLHVVSCCQ